MIDVEQLRSKILDLAISGKLVPQDPNDEPASVLLERIQKEKEALVKAGKIKKADPPSVIYKGSNNRYYEKAPSFEHPIDISNEIPCSLPEGWAWTRLSNICASIEYGLSYSAKKDGENKYLRITDIQDGEVNWENVPYVTIAPGEERFYLRSGDIVFARTGATVGKSFLIMKVPERSVFASYLIRISPIDCRISQYISFFFGSSFYWKQITNTSVGTGQPNCNGTKLANLLIPFPPLKVQEKINANLQNILPVVMRIGREQKKISFVATALKREILKSFFASDKSYYQVSLGQALNYQQPGPYIVSSTDYSPAYSTPVLTAGKTFILGYTNEKNGIYKAFDKEVIIFDDFTTATHLVNFDFKVKSSAMKILASSSEEKFDIEYLYFLLKTIHPILGTHKRFWISEYSNLKISVPNISQQKMVVSQIKRSFLLIDSLVN